MEKTRKIIYLQLIIQMSLKKRSQFSFCYQIPKMARFSLLSVKMQFEHRKRKERPKSELEKARLHSRHLKWIRKTRGRLWSISLKKWFPTISGNYYFRSKCFFPKSKSSLQNLQQNLQKSFPRKSFLGFFEIIFLCS